MAQIPINEALNRFKDNEDRLDKFVNDKTGYTTSSQVRVESIPAFLNRVENKITQDCLPLTGGTINGSLTVQAANAQYAGIHINNTDPAALGSFLGLDVGGQMRGGLEVFGEGGGSYSVALTATPQGDSSDRHERVLSAAAGYVWTRAYGLLHDYFARKTDLTNQINNKFTHSNYPTHYAGAEVWRLPNGLKITIMQVRGINAPGDYYLPETYQGLAIAVANAVAYERGVERMVLASVVNGSNSIKIYVSDSNVAVNIIVVGWANP